MDVGQGQRGEPLVAPPERAALGLVAVGGEAHEGLGGGLDQVLGRSAGRAGAHKLACPDRWKSPKHRRPLLVIRRKRIQKLTVRV